MSTALSNKTSLKLSRQRRAFGSGRLPPDCKYIKTTAVAFRQEIEGEIITRKGSLSTYDRCLLQSVVRHQVVVGMAERVIRLEWPEMSREERLAWLREVGRSSDLRDRVLKELGLNRDASEDWIATLYGSPGHPPTVHEVSDLGTDSDAAGSPSESQAGQAGGHSDDVGSDPVHFQPEGGHGDG